MTTTESVLRKLDCQLGSLTRCDGSAQICQGRTTAIVGLYGPAEIRPHKENISAVTVEVSVVPIVGQSGVKDRAKEALINRVTSSAVLGSMHPRNGLHVGVQVLEDDGSLLSCIVNCTCLALMDSGFPMKSLFAAITCAVVVSPENAGVTFILDPDQTKLRKKSPSAVITMVFDSRNSDIISVHVEGKCSEENFQKAVSVSQEASKEIFKFYRDIVARKFSKEISQ